MQKILLLITGTLVLNYWTSAATAQAGVELSPAAVQLLNAKNPSLPVSSKTVPNGEIDSSSAQVLSPAARTLMHVDMTHLKVETEQSKSPSLKSKTELKR
jgi:hypothetical protein